MCALPDPGAPCPPERPAAGFTRIPKPTGPGLRQDCDACVHRILDPRFELRARRLPLRHADVILDDGIALCDACHRRFEAQNARITAAVDRARRGLARREPLPADALYALLDTLILQDLLPRPAPPRRPRSLVQKRQARAGTGAPLLQPLAAPPPVMAPDAVEDLEEPKLIRVVRQEVLRLASSDDPEYRRIVETIVLLELQQGIRGNQKVTEALVQAQLDELDGGVRDWVLTPPNDRLTRKFRTIRKRLERAGRAPSVKLDWACAVADAEKVLRARFDRP